MVKTASTANNNVAKIRIFVDRSNPIEDLSVWSAVVWRDFTEPSTRPVVDCNDLIELSSIRSSKETSFCRLESIVRLRSSKVSMLPFSRSSTSERTVENGNNPRSTKNCFCLSLSASSLLISASSSAICSLRGLATSTDGAWEDSKHSGVAGVPSYHTSAVSFSCVSDNRAMAQCQKCRISGAAGTNAYTPALHEWNKN